MKAKTTSSQLSWQSPDKQRTIWTVNVTDESGKTWPLKTYSEEIAKVGFEGEVETYAGKNPGEKFVKQPNTGGGFGGGGNNAARLKADSKKQNEIRAEWAIGKAIQTHGIFPLDDAAMQIVAATATKLYAMVDTVISQAGETA